MPYREILLTKRLLSIKLSRIKQYYEHSPIDGCHKNFQKLLKQSLDVNSILCGICRKPINEKDIGTMIVANVATARNLKKWYHKSCSETKNITTVIRERRKYN